MLESTALRALCCTELSDPEEVKEALEVWEQIRSEVDAAAEVDAALKNIAWIRDKCNEETMPCALFAVGAVVWCKEVGWGSWPGVVKSVDKDVLVIDYSPTEFTEVEANEVHSRVRPFLEGFSSCFRDVTSLGNCSADFEKSVDSQLQRLAPLFPKEVITDHIDSKVRGRWLQRMNKVSASIEEYLKSFASVSGRVRKVLDKREAERIRAEEIQERRRIQQELKEELRKQRAEAAAVAEKTPRYPSLASMEEELREVWKPKLDTSIKRGRNIDANDELASALIDVNDRMHRLRARDRNIDKQLEAVPVGLQKQVSVVHTLLSNGTPAEDNHIAIALRMRLPIYLLRLLLICYAPSAIYRDMSGMTLIHLAARYDNAEAITLICDHWKQYTANAITFIQNRDVDIVTVCDNYRRNAMHVACEAGSLSCLKVLHEKGINIDQRDSDGNTPLLWCASKNTSAECAFYLLNNGADKNAIDKKGRSTLFHSMISGLTSLSKVLVQNDVWLNTSLLRTFVSDMSMGREPHRIIFDSRSIMECRLDYLADEVTVEVPPATDAMSEGSGSDQPSSKRMRAEAVRTSNRVSSLVSNEVINQYSYEKYYWAPREHMQEVCKTTPEIIPKFVYATETLDEYDEDASEASDDEDDAMLSRSAGPYQCCSCEGDCSKISNCPCIMRYCFFMFHFLIRPERNGQRYPYTADGRFDFSKAKIYECGPNCDCSSDVCKLHVSQRGVSVPMVVCRTGAKGYGVMTTKTILKGSFVCSYVGEYISEDDLQKQEARKLKALAKNSSDFVTYAFQIHEGTDDYNIDSEYVGNVARFFNHSCAPNMKPVKVCTGMRYPTMAFFALRRIEAGEELTWKYVSGTKRRSGQRCHCNSPECIGYV